MSGKSFNIGSFKSNLGTESDTWRKNKPLTLGDHKGKVGAFQEVGIPLKSRPHAGEVKDGTSGSGKQLTFVVTKPSKLQDA